MSSLTDALIAAKLVGGSGGSGGGSGLPEIRTETVEVLALQTLAFEDREGVYGTTVAGTFDMAAGDTFTVTYDGDDYEVTVFEVEDVGILGFGNPSLAELGADTGEPFFGGYNKGMGLRIIASTSDPTHEVGISSTVYNPANGSILVVDGGEWKAEKLSTLIPFAMGMIMASGSFTVPANSSYLMTDMPITMMSGVPSSWRAGTAIGVTRATNGNHDTTDVLITDATFDFTNNLISFATFFNPTSSAVTFNGILFMGGIAKNA